MTEQSAAGSIVHSQLADACRLGKIGFRFSPAFTSEELTETEISTWFGEHNSPSSSPDGPRIPITILLKDGDVYEGIFLRCQCETCLLHQANFVLDTGVNLIAQGVGSRSICRSGTKATFSEARTVSVHAECQMNERKREASRDAAEKRRSKLVEMCEVQQARMAAGKDPWFPEEDSAEPEEEEE